MAITTKRIVPRLMSTIYDGTNGAELSDYMNTELLSDDGQKLVVMVEGNYYPTEINRNDVVMIQQRGDGPLQCAGALPPDVYACLYYELPEAGA